MDLLRAVAAVLRVEEVDDARPGKPAPVPSRAELGQRLFGPRRHAKMVTVLENHYRYVRNENRSRLDRRPRPDRGRLRRRLRREGKDDGRRGLLPTRLRGRAG